MVSEIRIYVEGGGDGRTTKSSIREGFGKFLEGYKDKAKERKISWNITACGSRNDAFDDFLTALRTNSEAFNILLVDSEELVRENDGPWAHLCRRDKHWERKDPKLNDEHYHLMVVTMEAWFVADIQTLREFYGQGFNNTAIPSRENVEQIDKPELESALIEATRNTAKGKYHKINHGAKLLGIIDPEKVRARADYCHRFFKTLADKINE